MRGVSVCSIAKFSNTYHFFPDPQNNDNFNSKYNTFHHSVLIKLIIHTYLIVDIKIGQGGITKSVNLFTGLINESALWFISEFFFS